LDDPLNLMRVMPPKGGQPCVFPHGFFVFETKLTECTK
jgi:hypothetical protein